MKVKFLGLITLAALTTTLLSAFAHDHALVCTDHRFEPSLDTNSQKQYSIKELMMTNSAETSYAWMKFKGVRGARKLTCAPNENPVIADGFRFDGVCEDSVLDGFRIEVKSSVVGTEAKETLVFIRKKSNGALISRLACDHPLLPIFLRGPNRN